MRTKAALKMSYKSNLLPNLRDHISGHGMTEILSGLFVGNFRDSRDREQLDLNEISHILSIHDDAKKLFKDMKYFIISAADSPNQNLIQFFPRCNDFIHAARLRNKNVLIHCLAGISRSVTIAASYIACVTSLNYQEAFQVVRSTRKLANPNRGFQKQLAEFEISGGVKKEKRRLLKKFRKENILGQPLETFLLPDDDTRCRDQLEKYRDMVEKGELCGGDCSDPGGSCPSGSFVQHLKERIQKIVDSIFQTTQQYMVHKYNLAKTNPTLT